MDRKYVHEFTNDPFTRLSKRTWSHGSKYESDKCTKKLLDSRTVERSRGIGNGFSMENTKEGTRNYSEYPIGRDGKKAWIRVKARRETMFRREEKPASLFATVLLEDYTF